jgi:hypothetical protein
MMPRLCSGSRSVTLTKFFEFVFSKLGYRGRRDEIDREWSIDH